MSDKFQGEYLKVKGEWGTDKIEAGGSKSITDDLSVLTVMFDSDKNGTILRGQLQKIAENLNKAVENDTLDDAGVGRLVKEYDGKIKQAVLEARKEGNKDVEVLKKNLNGILGNINLQGVKTASNKDPGDNVLLNWARGTKIGATVSKK